MATQVQNRRGTTAEHSTFTGAVGELTVDTTKDTVVVHDGAVAGGRPLLREDQSNLPTSAPTTGIYSASGSLAISTSSSERIRIGVSGQIGLGGANYGTSGQVLTSAGSGAAPTWQTPAAGNTDKIEEGNSSAEVIDTGTDGRFVVTTEGSERLRVDSSGRVGIGTSTPGSYAQLAIFGTANVATYGNVSAIFSDGTTGSARFHHSSGNVKLSSDSALAIGTGVSATEVARFDTSGRLLVGTSSASSTAYAGAVQNIQIQGVNQYANVSVIGNRVGRDGAYLTLGKSRGTTAGSFTSVVSEDIAGAIRFEGANGTAYLEAASLACEIDGTPSGTAMPGRIVLSTTAAGASSPTERMRILNNGTTDLRATTDVFNVLSNAAAGTTNLLIRGGNSATSFNAYIIPFGVYTNGNVVNTNGSYTALSDAKLKENIIDASSQWADLRAIRIRNWNFKPETGNETHRQIGPIAQELEEVCPGLVFETPDRDADGNATGEVTKGVNQSVLYMKAVKALQEAMERIETLEAKVAALESA